jgi:hypothetical protein
VKCVYLLVLNTNIKRIMTQILEKAWNTLVNLPEEKQETIAYMILEEIQDEHLWEIQFADSHDELSVIAYKVENEIKEGKYQKKGIDEL